MRRILILGVAFSTAFLASFTANAQYTSQRKSGAVVTDGARAPTSSSTTRAVGGASSSAVNPTSSRGQQGTTGAAATQNAAPTQASAGQAYGGTSTSAGDDAVDLPDFSVTLPKDTQQYTTEQKVILLEEYAKKQQQEEQAQAAAEQAQKDAIAKKLATEKPRPGYVFDENANEVAIPKGEIWVYSTGYEQGDLYGRVYCSWKMVLQNRSDAELGKLNLGVIWPSYGLEMSFENVAPNETKTQDMFMYSPNCPSLRTRPRLEPKECEIGPMKADSCGSYITLK